MDIKQEIFEKAKLVYRQELSASAEGSLNEMCAAAYAELISRLKDEVSIDTIHDDFVRAAGILSIAMFIGLDCPEVDSFSAGSVTLKKRGEIAKRNSVESLRNQAELMLAGCLKDGGFCFRAVKF
ncbi:MAG: hypothetical protein EOM51_01745 [Clostridia bacterium]|nr:hypothetical protein [Clostridia bacterium]